MITKLGKEKLEEHIKKLKQEINRTCEERGKAAEEGDLKENSAYIFLGERALVLYSQLDEAEADLKEAVLQKIPTQSTKITFGNKVTVLFIEDDRQLVITLVGKNDTGLKPGWTSCDSPIGIAMLGKKKNDQILVNDKKVKIIDISIGEI